MSNKKLPLKDVVHILREHFGSPQRSPTDEPFEMILLENVAYLASPARKREAFEVLKNTVGSTPAAILAADREALERVAAHGILKATFTSKLQECARIAMVRFGGNLGALTEQPLDAAKRVLRAFPGIGEPGADKILLFLGRHAQLAPDSNALRVLVRLGLVREEKSYARTYANSRIVDTGLRATPSFMQEAHLLLQRHGQTLCKRTAPRCDACPLASGCDYAHQNATVA